MLPNMLTRVLEWNVRDAFSDSDSVRLDGILATLEKVRPDIAVYPEAASERDGMSSKSLEVFRAIGHTTIRHIAYEDADGRQDGHRMLITTALSVSNAASIRLAGRSTLMLKVENKYNPGQHFVVFGVHFYDRSVDGKHEQRRLKQAQALCESIDKTQPTIVAGDLNAMDGHPFRRGILKAARPFVDLLPTEDPNPELGVRPRVHRFGSLASRLAAMADGRTMRYIYSHSSLKSTDEDPRSSRVPTIGRTPLDFRLDYVLASEQFIAFDHHVVRTNNNLSDHRPLFVDLCLSPDNNRPRKPALNSSTRLS